jgi:superfamily II DNA or RNA helicase
MPAEDWQAGLRRQFGRQQAFVLERLGAEPEFIVGNPKSHGRYRVVLRGTEPGSNFCSCPDFATNDLGTCKHIEFTLARLLTKRGGKALLAGNLARPYSEIYLSYRGERCLRFHAGTQCPPALAKKGAALFDGGADGKVDDFLRAAAKVGHEVRYYDDARAFIAERRDAARRRRLLAHAYPKGVKDPALRKLLKASLYPYQAEGALFAAAAGRSLIGDEMGLGKTVQAIAAAELLSRHCGAERVLVVCPTSLKHQWQREIARFTGRDSMVIQGLRAARQQQYSEPASSAAWAKITNYDTLARDLDLIHAWSPDIVIVDEAQRVKNWDTIAARALKRVTSPYAIVLTGTPLENRLEELISIVQFVDQHRLGPTWRLLHEHQQRDDAGRVVGYKELGRIGATLAPIMLRRRKAEVLAQLPERIDKTLFVPMTGEQQVHHRENGDIVARIVSRWRRTGFLSDADQRRLTCALQNMRMSCDSTYLLDEESDHGTKAGELMTVLDEIFEQEPKTKVVVFSQWVRMHELIVRRLAARGWGHVLFHGGVPAGQRPALVDRFHEDPGCRVFLATDAGGVGLNLQHAAAVVVNMDLPWNPAVLEQRIGRVHRMGQRQSVQVVNFVAQGSIEEGMLEVLSFKKSLFAGVLDGGPEEVFLQGTRLSKFMDSVERVTHAIGPAEALQAAEAGDLAGDLAGVARAGGSADVAQAGGSADVAQAGGSADVAQADASPVQAPSSVAQDAQQPQGPSVDPWAPLLSAGLALISELARRGEGTRSAMPAGWIERDAATGRECLKLPLPQPDVIERVADALGTLARALRREA